MFTNLLMWLIGLVFYVPFTMLRLVADYLPACSAYGMTTFANAVMVHMVHWLQFVWPVIRYFPLNAMFNLLSAAILYLVFKWLWSRLPWLMSRGIVFWVIVAVFYLLAGYLNFFSGSEWASSPMFEGVFGNSATSSIGEVGGGGGGGGGGSW